MRKIAAGVAVLLLVTFAQAAFAARPPGGATYVGKTSQGQTVKVRVTSDGKGLQLDFRHKLSCNRGGPISAKARYAAQRPTIRPDGTFDYDKTYTGLPAAPPFRANHTQRQRVTGSAGSKTVRGSVRDTVTDSSGLRCAASLTFRASRS